MAQEDPELEYEILGSDGEESENEDEEDELENGQAYTAQSQENVAASQGDAEVEEEAGQSDDEEALKTVHLNTVIAFLAQAEDPHQCELPAEEIAEIAQEEGVAFFARQKARKKGFHVKKKPWVRPKFR